MAKDKVVDSAVLDANLTAVADAIRAKAGASGALAFPEGFVSAVSGIQAGSGGNDCFYTRITPAETTGTYEWTFEHNLGRSVVGMTIFRDYCGYDVDRFIDSTSWRTASLDIIRVDGTEGLIRSYMDKNGITGTYAETVPPINCPTDHQYYVNTQACSITADESTLTFFADVSKAIASSLDIGALHVHGGEDYHVLIW